MSDAEPDEFMARLDPADRTALAQRGRQRRWPAGASLFLEGESCATVVSKSPTASPEPVNRAQLTSWVSGLAHTQGAWAPGTAVPTTVVFAP